jgi:hypothetical protein
LVRPGTSAFAIVFMFGSSAVVTRYLTSQYSRPWQDASREP